MKNDDMRRLGYSQEDAYFDRRERELVRKRRQLAREEQQARERMDAEGPQTVTGSEPRARPRAA